MNHDQLSSLLFFLAGLAVCLFSLPYRLGTLAAPQSGLMPFLSGAAMCGLALVGFVSGTLQRRRGVGWRPVLRGAAWRRSLLTLLALLGWVVLLKPLGFLLTTVLFVGFLLAAILPQRWSVVVSVALLTALLSYLIFQTWLQAQLPVGPLGM